MNQLLDLHLGISSQQQLLLKAAILHPEEAISFWNKWKENQRFGLQNTTKADGLTGVFDLLDYDSRRLLPLVFHNLENSDDLMVESMRVNYRYNLLKGKFLLNGATKLTDRLQKAGFDVMLIKGIPVALLYYENLGLRPMDDIDIFIPPHQTEKAIEFLTSNLGLTVNYHENELRKLGMFHAIHFTDGKSLDVDLHCNFHIYNLNAESDQPMWDHKIPLSLGRGVSTFTVSPTHQLYRNFTHGYPWLLEGAAIRWVPDSIYILKNSGTEIDWEGLFELATKQKMILPVCSMLRYLRQHFSITYPPKIDQYLNRVNGSKVEQYYFRQLIKAESYKGREWKYLGNKLIRIFLRYYLFQERDIRDGFSTWLVKRITYTRIFKKLSSG